MGNYFNYKNAWKHLFFVTGLTADEFFTDSGMKMDIEQFTHLELKKSPDDKSKSQGTPT